MDRVDRFLQGGDWTQLQRFREIYETQLMRGPPSSKAEYDYACCLVRSPNRSEVHQGILFLEDLFRKTKDDFVRSEYLFFLSVGHMRLKEYEKALKYCNAILRVEPRNSHALELREIVERRMQRDGLIGMALVGSALVLVFGGILSLVMICRRRK